MHGELVSLELPLLFSTRTNPSSTLLRPQDKQVRLAGRPGAGKTNL